jgi:hypothetical protein
MCWRWITGMQHNKERTSLAYSRSRQTWEYWNQKNQGGDLAVVVHAISDDGRSAEINRSRPAGGSLCAQKMVPRRSWRVADDAAGEHGRLEGTASGSTWR